MSVSISITQHMLHITLAEEVLKRRKLVSDILKLLRNMENSQKFEKMSTEEMEKLKTILEQY